MSGSFIFTSLLLLCIATTVSILCEIVGVVLSLPGIRRVAPFFGPVTIVVAAAFAPSFFPAMSPLERLAVNVAMIFGVLLTFGTFYFRARNTD